MTQPSELKGCTQIVEPAWSRPDEREIEDTLRAAKGIGAAALIFAPFWAALIWWIFG